MTSKITFFQEGHASEIYEKYRDNPSFVERKAYIEWMFSEYIGFQDRHFLSDAKEHFWERLWEMHLHVTLKHKGFSLVPTRTNELDIKIQLPDKEVIWVEATFPKKGSGPNAAPVRYEYEGNLDTYIDAIIPRITQALIKKRDQIKKKALSSPIVVAITSADVDDLPGGSDLDIIEATLYDRGNEQMSYDRKFSYARKKPVLNRMGAPIPTDLFEDASFNQISAVLYRHKHPAVTPVELDDDILVIHNQNAIHPLLPEMLPIGLHRWWAKKEGLLKSRDFRQNPR